MVSLGDSNLVTDIRHVDQADLWINGGFFAFKRAIFDYIGQGEDLVAEPFQRLFTNGRLVAYKHHGFWACMDTFKDKQRLDEMSARGDCPWEVWRTDRSRSAGLVTTMNGGRRGRRHVPRRADHLDGC
jgi:glucose-1-phosphate cytidylyltransferase